MRRVRTRARDAGDAPARDAVVVLPGLADRALAAPDPRMHEPLFSHQTLRNPGPHGLHDAEGLVAQREGRHAAALLHVEALAAAELEVAFPDVQVRMAYAGARDAHQHFGALRARPLQRDLRQPLGMLD